MKHFFRVFLIVLLWVSIAPKVLAEDAMLVPCQESPAFLARAKRSPQSYYFEKPNIAYSQYLLCGSEGLPHLPLRLDRAVDIAIPIGLFLYIAGFIGWSGRAYLQTANKAKEPAQKEIFIDVSIAIQSLFKGLLWPLLALQELLSGQLTAKEREISVSPR